MIEVVPALQSDIPEIQSIARKTWPETYGKILSAEQLNYMLDTFYSDEKLSADMASGQRFHLLKENGRSVGFTGIQHDHRPGVTHLHKIYLLPQTQGKGFGKLLLNHVIHQATENRSEIVSLNVNRFNKARDFYERFGFVITQEIDIEIGRGYLMEDYIMEKTL